MIHFEVDERWVHHIRQHPPHLCEYLWLWVFELWGARTSENLVSHLACGNLLAQEARKNPYRETNPHAARGRQIERGRVPNIRSWNLAMGVGMDGLWAEVVGPFFFWTQLIPRRCKVQREGSYVKDCPVPVDL